MKFKKLSSVFALLFLGFVFLSCQAEAIYYVKVIFIGNYGSGKSDLRAAYLGESFDADRAHDSNLPLTEKTINHRGETFQLKIWDTAGEEEYQRPVGEFFQDSSIAFVTIDLQEAKSKEFVHNDMLCIWLKEISSNTPNCRIVLAGTKADRLSLDDIVTANQKLNEFADCYSRYFHFPNIQVIITATIERRNDAQNDVEGCIKNAIDNIGTKSLSSVDKFIKLCVSTRGEEFARTFTPRQLPAWFGDSGCFHIPVDKIIEHFRIKLGKQYVLVVDDN